MTDPAPASSPITPEHAEALLHWSGDLFLVTDLRGWIVWAAGAWDGLDPGHGPQFTGRRLTDMVHPEDRWRVWELLDPDHGGTRIRARLPSNRGYRWVELNGQVAPQNGHAYAVGRDITDWVEARDGWEDEREELEQAALTDPLTGLPNRRALEDHLRRSLARGARGGHGIVVLFCDLKGFKVINDELGHECGDEAFVEMARRLEHEFRASDIVARVGGDEFVVVVEARGPERFRDRVERALGEPLHLRGHEYRAGATVGAVEADPSEAEPRQVIDRADRAMYERERVTNGEPAIRPAGPAVS